MMNVVTFGSDRCSFRFVRFLTIQHTGSVLGGFFAQLQNLWSQKPIMINSHTPAFSRTGKICEVVESHI